MVVCAMVSAMAADTSLRASNCALAGMTNAQARPIAARRYDTTDMMKSSLGGRDRSDVAGGLPGKSLAHFAGVCMGLISIFRPRSRCGICGRRNAKERQTDERAAHPGHGRQRLPLLRPGQGTRAAGRGGPA